MYPSFKAFTFFEMHKAMKVKTIMHLYVFSFYNIISETIRGDAKAKQTTWGGRHWYEKSDWAVVWGCSGKGGIGKCIVCGWFSASYSYIYF